jgi:hypothetical protein
VLDLHRNAIRTAEKCALVARDVGRAGGVCLYFGSGTDLD